MKIDKDMYFRVPAHIDIIFKSTFPGLFYQYLCVSTLPVIAERVPSQHNTTFKLQRNNAFYIQEPFFVLIHFKRGFGGRFLHVLLNLFSPCLPTPGCFLECDCLTITSTKTTTPRSGRRGSGWGWVVGVWPSFWRSLPL